MKPFPFFATIVSAIVASSLIGAMSSTAFAQGATDMPHLVDVENASIGIRPAEASQNSESTTQINPDESADDLNARQQLKQTFTLRRTINGEVVETTKRVITFDPKTPYRETEAGGTTLNRLRTAFDGELLTRVEAFEEAKIDFTIADIDNNGMMDISEFEQLVVTWKETGAHIFGAQNDEISRQSQYEEFLAEISPETAHQKLREHARKKFQFLSGITEQVTLKDYIREYLLDFDSMDTDNSTTLSGSELVKFRALNNGETVSM